MSEFVAKDFGVGVADAEGYQGANVPEDGLADREGELVDVLVRESEAETVFASLGQDGGEGVGAEVLEFIDEQVEVPLLRFGDVSPGHGGELELSGEQGTEKVRFVVAQPAFGEVDDENAVVVHQEPSGATTIDTVSFFETLNLGGTFAEADYANSLSTTPKAVNGLDTSVFANNLGGDNALFITVHLAGAVPTTLTFDGTNFNYDPANGNLLVDIARSNYVPGTGFAFLDARNGDFGTDSSRAHNFGSGFDSFGLRTAFNLPGTAKVPDSGSTGLLLASAIGGCLLIRRRIAK